MKTRWLGAALMALAALLVTGSMAGLHVGGPAVAQERKTAGLPQIWYSATSPLIRSARKWPANDYGRLFEPSADAEWKVVADRLDVMLIGAISMRQPTDEQMVAIIETARRHRLKLALNAHVLQHDPHCGGGEAHAPDDRFLALQLNRIKRLGGRIDYLHLDEPLIRGHLLKNLGGGRVGCQYPIAEVARRVRANVLAARAVFPDMLIGSSEAINVRFTGKGPEWADSIRAWAEAFRAETGKPLAFTMVAVEYREPGWEPALRAWFAHAKRLGIPSGVIYTGAGGQSDDAWSANAVRAFQETERAAGVQPDLIGIMSWQQWPNFNLPASKPGTLTNVVLEYLRFRGVRN